MNWTSPWMGFGIFLYAAVATVFWAGVKLYEREHPHHVPNYFWSKWAFVFLWPFIPILFLLDRLITRWYIWRAKQLARKFLPQDKVDELINKVIKGIKWRQE